MEHLWAPWRMAYIAAEKPSKPKTDGVEDCFLCQNSQQNKDRDNLILHRTVHNQVVLNRFPYNNGHLLIAPLRHVPDPRLLNAEELADGQAILLQMMTMLEHCMKPNGFNCGLNLGAAAGAGLPGHLHWHIVPRWNGDANFMPVVADTKVLVQSLNACYDLLLNWLAANT